MNASHTSPWADASAAAAIFAVAPYQMGGIALRAGAGPVRDRWMKELTRLFGIDASWSKVPLHITDERLLGGLDLAATLTSSRPVIERGVLANADGGVVLLSMAERVSGATAARIAQAIDLGEVVLERDGLASRAPSRFGVVALDEGAGDDERPPAALLDRLAFMIDLNGVALSEACQGALDPFDIATARDRFDEVHVPEAIITALCATAMALGVSSLRASLFAAQVARAAAALEGRDIVDEEDASLAARLVFAPRATCLPAADEESPDASAEAPPEAEGQGDTQHETPDVAEAAPEKPMQQVDTPLEEVVLEATRAAIPPDLLARLQLLATGSVARADEGGRADSNRAGAVRGRPMGVAAASSGQRARIHLIETLRAAAPWQVLRRRESRANSCAERATTKIDVRREDFRVRRYIKRSRNTTIFLVDASGSAALHRLAETKGAVELLLAECYIRRDQVAVIAFRQETAELLLPPTRSMARAKRSLASLPASGGTPLATALDAGAALADGIRRKGGTPIVVVLSDGRANIARDGTRGRMPAHQDAMQSALQLRSARLTSLFVDTSPEPSEIATALALQMGARYVPLPYVDATALSNAVKASLQ